MGGVRGWSYNELSVFQLTLLTEHPQNLNHRSAEREREREREEESFTFGNFDSSVHNL